MLMDRNGHNLEKFETLDQSKITSLLEETIKNHLRMSLTAQLSLSQAKWQLTHFFLALLLLPKNEFARGWFGKWYLKLFGMFKATDSRVDREDIKTGTERKNNESEGDASVVLQNQVSLITMFQSIGEIAGDDALYILARLATLANTYGAFEEVLSVDLWFNLVYGAMVLNNDICCQHHKAYLRDLEYAATTTFASGFEIMDVLDTAAVELKLWNDNNCSKVETAHITRVIPIEKEIGGAIQQSDDLTHQQKFLQFMALIKLMPSINDIYVLINHYREYLAIWIGNRCDLWHTLLDIVHCCCDALVNTTNRADMIKKDKIIEIISRAYARVIVKWPDYTPIEFDTIYKFFAANERYLTDIICLAMVRQKGFLIDSRFMKFLHPFLKEDKANVNKDWQNDLFNYCCSVYNNNMELLLKEFVEYDLDWRVLNNALFYARPLVSKIDLETGMHLLSFKSINSAFAEEMAKVIDFKLNDAESVRKLAEFCLDLLHKKHFNACDVILKKCNNEIPILQQLTHPTQRLIELLSSPITLTYLKFSALQLFVRAFFFHYLWCT